MAYPFRSILSPIQFDDPSLVALGLAKQIAMTHGATLHLLHVVPKLPAFGEPEISEGGQFAGSSEGGNDAARHRVAPSGGRHERHSYLSRIDARIGQGGGPNR